METSATKLMKELKAIENEINAIHKTDIQSSSVPVDEDYKPRYQSTYNYLENREKVKNLQSRERKIRTALGHFNSTTFVEGFDMTINDALIRMAQIKNELKTLVQLSEMQEYHNGDYRYSSQPDIRKVAFDLEAVKNDVRNLQSELTDLQVAVDRTNLNSSIDC